MAKKKEPHPFDLYALVKDGVVVDWKPRIQIPPQSFVYDGWLPCNSNAKDIKKKGMLASQDFTFEVLEDQVNKIHTAIPMSDEYKKHIKLIKKKSKE